MDRAGLYDTFGEDQAISLQTLRGQYAYKLGKDVEIGKKITGSRQKALYEAKWLNGNNSPIVLIEKNGIESAQEILYNLTLSHRYIITTHGLVDPNHHILNPNSVLILQEYAKDGDLGYQLQSKMFIPEQSVFAEIFLQIADAMIYLSQNNVVHGDLGCRNVLVIRSNPHLPKENCVKLIDFGLTRNVSKSSSSNNEIPVRFVPKEILQSNGRTGYSIQSDVYTFGVFMHESCSFGKMPYADINDDKEVWRQKLNGKRLSQPAGCDPNLWKLMVLCWHDRPEKRPSFQNIHTQLNAIQTIHQSQSHSNSLLFPVEFQTCSKCRQRYTDRSSHTHICREEEIHCEECNRTYRRGGYDAHQQVCDGVFHENSFSQEQVTPSYTKSTTADSEFSSTARNRYSSNLTKQTTNTNRSNLYRPRSHIGLIEEPPRQTVVSNRVTNRIPVQPLRTNRAENSSQTDLAQIPCEFCNKLFSYSVAKAHQAQCKSRDDARLESKRKEIERQDTRINIECEYCRTKHPVEEIDEHQNICPNNPANVPDTPDIGRNLSLIHSISDHNLYNHNERFDLSTSSSETIGQIREIQPIESMDEFPNLNTRHVPSTTASINKPVQKKETVLQKLKGLFSKKKK